MALEELDDMPWAQFECAYGNASDIPDLLRALVADDEKARSRAVDDLFGSICHQGTVYEATGHALPFLIEVLQLPSVPDRTSVVHLVAAIICGTGYYQVNGGDRLPPDELQRRLTQEGETVRRVREIGQQAVPIILPHLPHHEPEIRGSVAEGVAAYPELEHLVRPALVEALARESDEYAKERIADSLATLG